MRLVKLPSGSYVNPDHVVAVHMDAFDEGVVVVVTERSSFECKPCEIDAEMLALFDGDPVEFLASLIELGSTTEWTDLITEKRAALRRRKTEAEIERRLAADRAAAEAREAELAHFAGEAEGEPSV